jgi:predicted transcriptional regulator
MGGRAMLTVRLPQELENRLRQIAASEKRTKTQVIRAALEGYLQARQGDKCAAELGEDLFGRHGSGDGQLSSTYKSLLKERIRAKRAR